jgi:hypothetical protein
MNPVFEAGHFDNVPEHTFSRRRSTNIAHADKQDTHLIVFAHHNPYCRPIDLLPSIGARDQRQIDTDNTVSR